MSIVKIVIILTAVLVSSTIYEFFQGETLYAIIGVTGLIILLGPSAIYLAWIYISSRIV